MTRTAGSVTSSYGAAMMVSRSTLMSLLPSRIGVAAPRSRYMKCASGRGLAEEYAVADKIDGDVDLCAMMEAQALLVPDALRR